MVNVHQYQEAPPQVSRVNSDVYKQLLKHRVLGLSASRGFCFLDHRQR